MEEIPFDLLVQTCCVIIRGLSDSNIHKDVRKSIAALEDAVELSEHEVAELKEWNKNNWPPSSVSFNWYLDSRSGQEACTILLNSTYKLYDGIVPYGYQYGYNEKGDYMCWDCLQYPCGPNKTLGDAQHLLQSAEARTLIYIKGRPHAKPRSLRLELAECVEMLDRFLKEGTLEEHLQIERPLRQVIFSKWRLPNEDKRIRPHGKMSLSKLQEGPLQLTWLTYTGMVNCLQCRSQPYFFKC
jgi:hypothetical protein